MSLAAKIRRGEGPIYGLAKDIARRILHAHIPVNLATKRFFSALYTVHVIGRESIIWMLRFFWYEPLLRSQCERIGSGFQMEQLPYIFGRGKIIIGSNVRLSGKSAIGFSYRDGQSLPELRFGDATFIGHDCRFEIRSAIRVGDHCLIASGVHIQDHDGHPLDALARRAGKQIGAEQVAEVNIGDDVWIGSHAMILKGVTIGQRSVVGARSVVTKDVPPNVIVAGNPARVVRELDGGQTDF